MKKLLTLALLITLSCPLLAGPVDQQKAAKVAETVLNGQELAAVSMGAFNNLYVFNAENSFVMVAADDCARPVLAYSKEFSFKLEDMPLNIQEWLSSLNDEIQDAIDKKWEASEETRQEWELLLNGQMPEPKNRNGVGPLVQTHWDQYPPYSNMCPTGSFTGCVATAMAQLMKYWEWPHQGVGSHGYNHATYGYLSANFGNTTYDWDNMWDVVYEDDPTAVQNAVATLVYHCGIAVDMDYGPESSTAFTEDVPNALKTYFDYNPDDIQLSRASDYGTNAWVAFVKSELDQGRPMVYRGQGDGGGHAFICDGYDAYNYLHFNWGWGGYCDGFYAYGALNPGTGGAGSGSGSYNLNNFAITGAHPNTPPISAPRDFSLSALGLTVTLQWSPVSGASRYKVYCDGFVIHNNVTSTSFVDDNPLYGYHTYFVKAVNANGVCSLRSEVIPVELTYPGPIATNVTANVQGNNVLLSWTAPPVGNGLLVYGQGDPASNCYGSTSGSGFTWGQCYLPYQLAPYAGMAITSVDVYLPHIDNYKMTIHRETDDDWETLISGTFTNPSTGWCTVNLPNPIPIDYLNNLWIVFYNDNSQYNFVAAYTENYFGSDNARLYVGSDGYWYSINDDISWLIMINAVDDNYTYSVYRNGHPIASDITQTNYSDYGLPSGNYQYTIRTQYYDQLSESSEIATAIIGQSVAEDEASLLTVYPNPTSDKVTVRCEKMESISVLSVTGQTLMMMETNSNQAEVDLSNLQPGMYVLMIQTSEGTSGFTRIAKH